MRILIALTYYRPHVSGLTVYAERLARGRAARGHAVTILTSRFAPHLPARELIDNVDVIRVPVVSKVSKGVIMPLFPAYAAQLVPRHDVVNIHMPQFEAALLGMIGRATGRGVVVTYQCDLQLPAGWLNRLVERSLLPLNAIAARSAHAIVVMTSDYAAHSRFLSRYAAKVHQIPALIDGEEANPAITRQLEERWHLNGCQRVGFAARFAAEKGVEYLLRALPQVLDAYPHARIIFTGAYKNTIGEDAYRARLEPLLRTYADRLTFLDLLEPSVMPSYFALCDVLAVTSINSTESFGLVQAEAMLAGTPVVATDLPGVREAVQRTGMGLIVPPRDPDALARALIRVLRERDRFVQPHESIAAEFALDPALQQYEDLFHRVAGSRHRA